MVFLNDGSLFPDPDVGVGDFAFKKLIPFGIGKPEIVQGFQLVAQVVD